MTAPLHKVGPGLPAQYDMPEPKEALIESPFTEMSEGHLCVRAEGFKYTGRLVIPQSAKRNSTAGRVIDAAPGSKYPRGTRVLYSQFAGYLFHFEGATGMRVMGENEILGQLKENVKIILEED